MLEWVTLDTATMKNARKALGFSYETMGRKLNISAKTYERYEKNGKVPRQLLPAVADALGSEIDEPARQRVTVVGDEPTPSRRTPDEAQIRLLVREEVAAALVQVEALLEQILRRAPPESPADGLGG